MSKINKAEVEKRIEQGLIDKTKHPTLPLWILNYTKECQFAHAWDEYTNVCRGLIVDAEYNIIQRPFVKFFNYEEIEDKTTIPNLPFEAFEKLDGSLGILYWAGDEPYIATRGSFTSDMAVHATWLLHERYSEVTPRLDKSKTYLFEIIYPENHIVVNYGDTDDIFLLAVIDTETGEDEDLRGYENIGFKTTPRYDGISDYKTIREHFSGDNKEGFVIKFSNGFRMKMKFAEYFRIHTLLCGISEKKIFELVVNGQLSDLADIIENLDEENALMIKGWRDGFYERFAEILTEAHSDYRDFETDKEAAFYFNTCKHSAVLFGLRKGKDVTPIIWRIIKKERNF